MRRLTLIRHAKSSWQDANCPDFERPLNRRGQKNAPEMGERLARAGFRPDAILTSPARRALDTAGHIVAKIGWPAEELQLLPELYAAETAVLVEIVRRLDESRQHVVLCGHNPGLSDFADWLTATANGSLPTGAVLDLQLDVDQWAQLRPGCARILAYDFPKKSAENR